MRSAGSWWLAGSLLVALAACAVGGSDGDTSRPRRDAGTDASGDPDDAGDGEDEEDAGPGGPGAGGDGGEGDGTGGAAGDGSGGAGGAGGAGGSGGDGSCTPPNGGTCDPVAQCGCNADQGCHFISLAGTTGCLKAGTTVPYAKCSTDGECQAGTSCVSGLCTPFCATAADCPGSGRSCQQVSGGNPPQDIPGYLVCTAKCDPINPSAVCGGGVTCLAFPGNDDTDCFVAGTATSGKCAGKRGDECAPGYRCAGESDATLACRKWCRRGMNDCPNCAGFHDKIIVDGIEYGVCT